jgi:membrane protein YdbS with pleckstrin-like domain
MASGQIQIGVYASFRPVWRSLAVYFLGVLIFALGPQINPQAPISPTVSYLVSALFLAFLLQRRLGQHYAVSEQAVEATTSLPKTGRQSLPIASIGRIDLRRGLSQRLLGVAHVFIYADDRPEPALKLYGVPDPEAFKRLLIDLGARDQAISGAWRR